MELGQGVPSRSSLDRPTQTEAVVGPIRSEMRIIDGKIDALNAKIQELEHYLGGIMSDNADKPQPVSGGCAAHNTEMGNALAEMSYKIGIQLDRVEGMLTRAEL